MKLVQSGRSMVEMLAVLAISGILLSVGVISFQYLIDTWKLNNINTRLSVATSSIYPKLNRLGNNNISLQNFVRDAFKDYNDSVESEFCSENSNSFRISIPNITKGLCQRISKHKKANGDYNLNASSEVPIYVYQGTGCPAVIENIVCENNNEIVFLFDIANRRDKNYCVTATDCSEGQNCEDNECVCPENAPVWNGSTCEPCPTNNIWTGEECVECLSDDNCSMDSYCIENTCSPCPDDTNRNNTGGEVGQTGCRCPSEMAWTGTACIAQICVNPQNATNEQCKTCPDDTVFFQHDRYLGGASCELCSDENYYYTDEEECDRCSNRWYSGYVCYLGEVDDICATGHVENGIIATKNGCRECPTDTVFFQHDRYLGGSSCVSCLDTNFYYTDKEDCDKCPDRKYANGICYLEITEEHCIKAYNMEYDDLCYPKRCALAATEEDCKSCQNNTVFWTSTGCSSCANTWYFSSTQAECDRCSERWYSGEICYFGSKDEVCTKAYNMEYDDTCYPKRCALAATEEGCKSCQNDTVFWTSTGCTSCASTWYFSSTQAECDRCSERYYQAGKCYLCSSATEAICATSCAGYTWNGSACVKS